MAYKMCQKMVRLQSQDIKFSALTDSHHNKTAVQGRGLQCSLCVLRGRGSSALNQVYCAAGTRTVRGKQRKLQTFSTTGYSVS
jgi:hypothetical protein